MQMAVTFDLLRHFGPLRLGGAVLDKELRVASRRVRYYALRTLYAGALMFLVMVTWSATVRTGPAVVLASRMPEVAKSVTTAVTWLQFLAAQGLAVILLSSAIGEEIRKGTLGALLTTPISSFQIVIGKLLSRMLQVLVLLAMSLPVLAILRLLGGVPGEYVLAGGCITLTTTLFVGALSLWLSTYYRYGSKTISTVVLTGIILFVVPQVVLSVLGAYRVVNVRAVQPILEATNPFLALSVATAELWIPRAARAGAYAPWMLNTLVMLGLALLLLILTIRRVRKAAAGAISGERRSVAAAVGRARRRFLGGSGATPKAAGPVKHVKGSPVVWKETRRGLVYGWSLSDIAICVIALGLAIVPLFILGSSQPSVGLGLFIAGCLAILLVVRLAVECAGNVPREREARTWPILLTTLLEDREIVNGKIKAALLRNTPLPITLAAISVFLFAASPHVELLWVWGWSLMSLATWILLVIGIGSYLGLVIKTRMVAVLATIAVCLALKYGIGWMFAAVGLALVGGPAAGSGWVAWGFLIATVVPAGVQVIIAVAAVRVAAQRVRHDVF